MASKEASPLHLTLKLSQSAKSAGGDKYQMSPLVEGDTKERFIYVPQKISRESSSSAKDTLTLTLTLPLPLTLPLTLPEESSASYEFKLFKAGKTGDDRYKSVNEQDWSGDIYLPQSLRNDKLFLSFC
jgi:hypothetical protein